MKNIMPYIAAGISIIFWSSAFPAVRYTLGYFSPESIMLYRFLVASSLLMIYCAVRKVPPPSKKDLPILALTGFFGVFLYMWAFNTGSQMVISGISGFIIASSPIFTLILSILFLKEKSGTKTWAGVLISFIGIIIIAVTQITDMQLNFGIWLLLFAATSTSIYFVLQKFIRRNYTAIQATAYPMAIGTVPMLIFIPGLLYELPGTPMVAHGLIIYLGVLPGALAYFLWGYALAAAKKTIYITSFLYLSPFLSSILAFFWLGEVMPVLALFGGVVVIAGLVISRQ